MSTASYTKKVQVSTDNATWHDLPATSPSMDIGGDVLDDTNLSNDGYRSRILGLHDWSVSADCIYNTDQALSLVRSAKINRTDLYVRYLPTGVNTVGLSGKVVVENFNLSGDVSSLEMVNLTLQGNGAITEL